MNALPGGMQVEKVLDDLIFRLANAEATPEVRAALVEAKRLKSVTTRWAAIPPPPDARREMLARVMELITSVNGATGPISSGPVSGSPRSAPPRNSAPPVSHRDARPITRREDRDTPVADAALPPEAVPSGRGTREPPPLRRTAPPPPPPAAFRAPPSDASRAPVSSGRRPSVGGAPQSPPPRPPPSDGARRAGMPSPETPRSVAPTRRPPPSRRPTKPPPPTAQLPHPDEVDIDESIGMPEPSTKSQAPPRPLTLRPPGGGPPPLPQSRMTPTHPQPFTRTQSALPAPDRAPAPIRAVPSGRIATLDGLSTSISSSKRHAVDEGGAGLGDGRLAPIFPRAPTIELTGLREVSAHIADGVTLVRPDATDWQPHPVAIGASLKLLYHDGQTGTYTALVRLSPASTFPARKHAAVEEMFLVSGVATVGSIEMRSGEYMRATDGSSHPEIRTATGCVFLVSGSEHDEMLAVEDDA